MKSKWSIKEYTHFAKTGQSPEEATASVKKAEKQLRISEKALQTICEQWLRHRGYKSMTADNASFKGNLKGWYGHLFNARKNPLMSDLFIYNPNMTQCVMIELKVRDVWQPGQLEMISRGAWQLAYDFATVEVQVKAFEARCVI